MKTFKGIKIHETPKEILDPSHTCLVVWDVQNGLVDRIFNRDAFLKNLKGLLDGVRGRMPIAYSLITPLPKEFQSGWGLYSMMRRFKVDDPEKLPAFMSPGSKEREIPAEVAPQPGDLVIEKSTPNFFLGTNLELMMRNRGVTTLVFTGIATDIGVETTARDAGARGFYPVIASDCCSSMDQPSHDRSLAGMTRSMIVMDSMEILQNIP